MIMPKKSAKRPVYKYKFNIGVEIDNYQWKIFLLDDFQTYIDTSNNEEKTSSIHI